MKKNDMNKPYMVIVHYNKNANYKYLGEIRKKKPQVFYFKTLEGAVNAYMEWKEIIKTVKHRQGKECSYKSVELSTFPLKIVALPPTTIRADHETPREYNVVKCNDGKYIITSGLERGFRIHMKDVIEVRSAS